MRGEMDKQRYYEIEWVTAPPGMDPPTRLSDANEIADLLSQLRARDFFFGMSLIDGQCDLGKFWLCTKGNDAWVRLDEHREHYGSDPKRSGCSDDSTVVLDGARVPRRETVSRQDALAAFDFWLRTRQKINSLEWP